MMRIKRFLILVLTVILFSASASAKSENVIWRELWEGIIDPILYFFGNLAQRVILVYGPISHEINNLLGWNSDNIRYYLLMNPILDNPAFSGLITYFIRILEPIYVVAILIIGIYFIFFSISPEGRSTAKSTIQRLILSMVLVSISIEIIEIIFRISTTLTSGILSLGPSNLMDTYTAAGLYLLRKTQEFMLVDISISAPFMLLSILLSSGIFLFLISRYFLVISLSVLFPIAISLYLFNPTKSMGNIILRQLFFWIFLPVMYALTLVTIAIGENSIGIKIPELRDMHLLSGALSILLSPLAMYYVTNWTGHTIAVSPLRAISPAGILKTKIGDMGVIIYPEVINISPEKSTKIELTIKNTGEKPLNIVKINDTGLSDKNIKLRYSRRGFTLEKYGEKVISIEISVGEDVREGAYSGSFVVTTYDGITATARILINVKPREALIWRILKGEEKVVVSEIPKKTVEGKVIEPKPKIIIHPETLREWVSSYIQPIIMQRKEIIKIPVVLGVVRVVPPVIHTSIPPGGTTKIQINIKNDSGSRLSDITLYEIDIPESIMLKYSANRFVLEKDEEKTVIIEIFTKKDIVEKSYSGSIMVGSAEGITSTVRFLVDVKPKEVLKEFYMEDIRDREIKEGLEKLTEEGQIQILDLMKDKDLYNEIFNRARAEILPIDIFVKEKYGFKITSPIRVYPESISAISIPGKPIEIKFTVENTIDKPLNIVKISDVGFSDKKIQLTYDTGSFILNQGEKRVITIYIFPSKDVPEGFYIGSVILTTAEGITLTTEIKLDLKSRPIIGLEEKPISPIQISPEIINISISPEKSTEIELTIKNTGDKPLNIIKLNDTGLSDKNIRLRYSRRGFTLEKYGEKVITIEISAGEDVIEGAYSGSFVVTTSDGITATAKILINVKPGKAQMWEILKKEEKLPEVGVSQVKIKHEEIISPIIRERITPTERREKITLERIIEKVPEEIKEKEEEIPLEEEIKPPEFPRFTLAPLAEQKPTKPISIP